MRRRHKPLNYKRQLSHIWNSLLRSRAQSHLKGSMWQSAKLTCTTKRGADHHFSEDIALWQSAIVTISLKIWLNVTVCNSDDHLFSEDITIVGEGALCAPSVHLPWNTAHSLSKINEEAAPCKKLASNQRIPVEVYSIDSLSSKL